MQRKKTSRFINLFTASIMIMLAFLPLIKLFDFNGVAKAENNEIEIIADKGYFSNFKYIGLIGFNVANIWQYDDTFYYSDGSDQYYLDSNTWLVKNWDGLTSFFGFNTWQYDDIVYYSNGTGQQYYLDGNTWLAKNWDGFKNLRGSNIWQYDNNVYYSSGNSQYYLDGNTWLINYWDGLTNFNVDNIWQFDDTVYYSDGSVQYYLDGYDWNVKNWNGLTSFIGSNIWQYDDTVYYSDGSNIHYYLNDIGNFESFVFVGFTSFVGNIIWLDSDNGVNVGSSMSFVFEDINGNDDDDNDIEYLDNDYYIVQNKGSYGEILGFKESYKDGNVYILPFETWEFPQSIKNIPITHISDNAFSYEKGSIVFQSGNSRNLVIPNYITHIGNNAFNNIPIESLTLNDGLLFIGNFAFSHHALDELLIPDTVYYIGIGAFSNNAPENTISTIYLPKNIVYLGDSAFGFVDNIYFSKAVLPILLSDGNSYGFSIGGNNDFNKTNYFVLSHYFNEFKQYFNSVFFDGSSQLTYNILTYESDDYSLGFDYGYNQGFDDGFADGSDNVNVVSYANGYDKGYLDGLAVSEDGYNSLFVLPASLLGTLFSVAYTWLNITVLGINLWSILLTLASVGFVIFVLKIFF